MSLKKILMPKLGESVTEGTINSWMVKEGDRVDKYDPIADVMTDKVNAEVPSSYSGIVKEIIVQEGETVAVGELICYMDTATEGSPDEEDTVISKPDTPEPIVQETTKIDDTSMRTRYSPAVLKLAAEHKLDLSKLTGTGLGGRITRKDVQHYIANFYSRNLDTPNESNQAKIAVGEGDKEISLTGIRKVIADNMTKSKNEVPHAWMTVEVDVTDLVAYRNKVKDRFKQQEGYSLTYFSFFVAAVSQALNEYPQLNSVWSGDKIIQKQAINISIAVAKEEDLFVPVIPAADEKSIKGIARNIYRLAVGAREGKLKPEDMTGGTFTLNNTGTFGSISSMGIINYPQVAILQVEAIVRKPVIIQDMFAARDMVNLSLSLDHRVLDGLICGRFLARVKEILEGMNENTIQV